MLPSAQVHIKRGTSYPDRLRAYKVWVDASVVGTVKAGQSLTVTVAPGPHTIRLRIDWCGSNTIHFDVAPDQVLGFDCGSSLAGWRVLLVFVYVSFLPNKYLWIRPSSRCPRCGYQLRGGFSQGCPECGWRREVQGVETP